MNLMKSMPRLLLPAVASVLAILAPSATRAETTFLGGLSNVPRAVNAGASGNMTINMVGVWKDAAVSAESRIEVSLPSVLNLNSSIINPSVSSRIFTRQNGNALQGFGGNIPFVTESDFVCGVVAFDVDPTSGDLYAIIGRNTGYSDSCNTSSRWLTRLNPETGVFTWIADLGRINSMEFLGDGRLVTVSATNGPGGRGYIYEVNKATGAMTARVNPSVGSNYRDVVFNPGDDMLYATERCNLIRIDPSDWSYTSEYNSGLCSLRRVTANLLSDNHILVRMDSYFYEVVVDPADGSIESVTNVGTHNTSHPRYPMISSSADASSITKSCSTQDGVNDKVTCTFGSLGYNSSVNFAIPVAYTIPADAIPGAYEGEARWYVGGTLVRTVPLNVRVLGNDLSVSLTPSTGDYALNDTFALTVEVEEEGGLQANDVAVNIAVPANLKVNSISGPGSCGLSRSGARCSGFSLGAYDSETITVNVEAVKEGAVLVVASLAEPDAVSSNNSSEARFVIGDSADLVASGTEGGKGAVGEALDLKVSVTNNGPEIATNARLRIPGDAGFDLGTASTDVGTCAVESGNVVCSFGDMAADDVATVSLKVTPQRVGKPVLTATATSESFDINAGNNSYAFAVSVPTKPFTVALGEASPTVSSGSIRSVLQLAVSPDASAGPGVRLTSIAGTMNIKTEGLGLKATVLVYDDVDANGLIDAKDSFVGEGSLSAANGSFNVEFSGGISAPTGKVSYFVLAVRENGGDTVAAAPLMPTSRTWTAMGLAGMLPFAFAGFALKRHRALAMVFGLVIGLTACSEELKDLLDSAKVTATVTSIGATLMEDHHADVAATGLPISGPTVTLTR